MAMSLGKKINICKKEFYDYRQLAKHLNSVLVEYVNGTRKIEEKKLINVLKDLKESLVLGKNSGAYEHLVDENFHLCCIDLLKLCMRSGDLNLLSALLSCIITFSDNSIDMCEALSKNGLSELLISLSITVCNDVVGTKQLKSGPKKSLFDQLILIVDNIAQNSQFQQSFLRCKDIKIFKDKILYFMNSKDHRTRILTMAAMTWLMEDGDDKTQFDFYSDIIINIVKYIERAMSEQDRRCEGLRFSEMMAVLQSLSNIQSIKTFMLRTKKVITLMNDIILSKKSTAEEIRLALGTLYNMSIRNVSEDMKNPNAKRFVDVINVETLIKPLTDSSDKVTRKFAEGIMSEISEPSEIVAKEICYDIFISCCHTDDMKIRKIAEILVKKGFKVWLSKENNKGSEINHVKESIAQSNVLVIEVSNSYFNNQCCHAQCQHAYKLKKPIIPLIMEAQYKPWDWFREIIHLETEIDFSNESDFDKLAEKLLNHIESTFSRVGAVKTSRSKMRLKQKSINIKETTIENKNVKEWTVEDVDKWLQFHKLSSIQENGEKFDGKMIEYVRKMKIDSHVEYDKCLKDDLKLSIQDRIKFDELIENLRN